MKPIFGSKIKSKNWITVVEGTKIIQKEGELAITFNECFLSIAKNLGTDENLIPNPSSEIRSVDSIIAEFENHPSIETIRNSFDENSIYSFKRNWES